jgi:hypothetical protein
MKLAQGIRRHGFRKWYERELLQSHAHLVLTFLCMIGIFAAMESLGGGSGWFEQAADLATIGLCTAIGIWAVRRYLYFLNHAEACANQADCPQCKAYGRMAVDATDGAESQLDVHCKKCNCRWVMYDE